jgi:hypothetical protein
VTFTGVVLDGVAPLVAAAAVGPRRQYERGEDQ